MFSSMIPTSTKLYQWGDFFVKTLLFMASFCAALGIFYSVFTPAKYLLPGGDGFKNEYSLSMYYAEKSFAGKIIERFMLSIFWSCLGFMFGFFYPITIPAALTVLFEGF